MPKHTTAISIADFRAAVAAEIQKLEAAKTASRSKLALRLSAAGIHADVTPGDGTTNAYQVTIKEDESAGLPPGTKRSEFTAEALAAKDAEFLRSERERIWQWLKRMAQRGYYGVAEVTSALESLGYTALPTPRTEVSYRVDTGQRDQNGDRIYDSVDFTLAGEVSEEEVKTRLTEAVQPTGARAVVAQAFPEAQNLPSVVTNLYVRTEQSWPANSEFYRAPSES